MTPSFSSPPPKETPGKRRPPRPDASPRPLRPTAFSTAAQRERGDWLLYGLIGALLLGALRAAPARADHWLLLLFLTGLAALTVWLPASGPRGQRIRLLPGLGLACALLLPVPLAALPALLAGAFAAATQETVVSRRRLLWQNLWLLAALLASGLTAQALLGWAGPSGLPARLAADLSAAALYSLLYIGGNALLLRAAPAPRRARRIPWNEERLDAAGLLASIPAVLLMALAYVQYHVVGTVAAAVLMALLQLVAHLAFAARDLREQVRAMEKISAVTVSQTVPQRVLEQFLQLSAGLIICESATLWLTDESQTRLERATPAADGAAGGARIPSVCFGEGLVGRVADRQSPQIVRGRMDGAPLLANRAAAASTLLLPLVVGGETIGVAQFEREGHGAYTPRDLQRLRSLTGLAAATIANVRMHHDVYTQAVTDGLTGLYNRRHVQTALADERRRAERYGHPLSVILLDIDNFKAYNDTYGHPQGDILLKMVAGLLRENVRTVDIVGRYGGEEFIVLLPETPREEAQRTAERLRRAIAGTPFPGHASDPEQTVLKTISLGVATYPRDSDSIKELVSLADQALYRAKRGGRNQVALADSLPALAP